MGKVLRTRAGYPVAVPNPAHRAVPTVISVAMHHSARLSFCEILGRPAEGPCVRREASESIPEASFRVLACFSRTLLTTLLRSTSHSK